MEPQDQDALSPCSEEISVIGSEDSRIIEQECMYRLEHYTAKDESDDTTLILRAFLDNLPKDGLDLLLKDIKRCNDDNEIYQLARSLSQGLLVPMLTRSKTPATITPSPRLGFEGAVEDMQSQLVEPSSRNEQSWLEGVCLERDGNRCVLSGLLDEKAAPSGDDPVTMTECAHIIPFSLGHWRSESEQRVKAQIWVNLNHCFPSLSQRIGFTQQSINEPRNAMTLDPGLHSMFGRFTIALEATNQQDVYTLKNYKPRQAQTFLVRGIEKVKFENHNTPYAVPDPILLETHAIIARIVHATGMAERVYQLQWKKDDTGTLAANGSTDVESLLSISSLAILASRPLNSTRPSAEIGNF
ncbi:hypothetical protein DTO166G4_4259 [Paecilomyces variotii]|nr:hypothetical protein DTO166G4_4259 [Paecilomyces variotii]KAJ9235196.1 hypothetical protein DTO166G5_4745 [Paecilomyces variotii]